MKARKHLSIALIIALLVSLTLLVSAQSSTPPSNLIITISGQGMTPTSATVSAGIVHLAIENQSGQEQLTLRVSRQGGELMRELSLPEKTKEWQTELELKSGQYVLSVSGSSSGSCQITAQAPPSESEDKQPGMAGQP